jgi:hypothetical protein
VVDDVMQNNFRDRPDPLVYYPLVGADADELGDFVAGVRDSRRRARRHRGRRARHRARGRAGSADVSLCTRWPGLASDSVVDVSFTM